MPKDDNRSFAQAWMELWGRQKPVEQIPFTEISLLTKPIPIRVGWLGYYLSLPSNTAAIIRSTTDKPMVFTEGGYKNLHEGGYTLQYIDMSERFFSLPKISAPALNTSEVSLKISIFYKVNDPSLMVRNVTPLKAFFSTLEETIKSYIATHQYDELIGEVGNENYIPNRQIIQHIKEQVKLKESCKAFWLKDITIEERSGNYELTKLRQERLVQESEELIQRENLIQKSYDDVASEISEKEELERIINEQNRIIKNYQTQFEAAQSEISELVRHLKEQAGTKNQDISSRDEAKSWDVFISHAFEDKEFARRLAKGLENEGVRIWFDEFELKIGDSLRKKIDFGLSNSRFGIIILSPYFFAKEWTQKELGALTAKETNGEEIILPIWHNISFEEVRKMSPILADKFSISSKVTLDKMIIQILDKVRSN